MVGTLPWKGRGWQGADIAVLSSGKRGREDSGGLWREAEKQTNPGWVARSATVQGPELGEHEGAAGKRKKKVIKGDVGAKLGGGLPRPKETPD